MADATKTAVDFLKKMYPEGPWCLTAISTNRANPTQTDTFSPKSLAPMKKFISKHAGTDNLYFHVNPVNGILKKKAKRENIASVNFLHVDVDPEKGMSIKDEQARILELFTTKLPKGIPEPTMIVYSGGGYQAFWKLEEPLKIDGDLGLAEDAKLYNMQIERVFNADNCHNIDRLMRLAGTMNIPDAKKQKNGRVPTMAAVMDWKPKNIYPISAFKKAPPVAVDGIGGGGKTKAEQEVKLSGNVERYGSLDFLRDDYGVDDITLVAINQGKDENNPKEHDNTRSAWVFHVTCQLARCEVPDDVIFSLLTDPDFGISESILEAGPNAEKYAIRQISRGKQHADDPDLLELNERFAVIQNMGGKCRIIEDTYNRSTGNFDLTKMTPIDFQNGRINREKWVPNPKAKDKAAVMPVKLGKWWFEHPKRRQYNRIVFEPGYDGAEDYNLWRGFAYPSMPGECQLFLDHIRDNVCDGHEGNFQYLINWMARTVQFPAEQGKVAVVLTGGKGTGKSFFATQFGELFGRHFKHISNGMHLVGQFNSHLRDCLLLFADEAFFAGDKKHESVLKTLITERTIPIEAKGIDLENVANYIHLIMASNSDHVVPAGAGERRYFVLDVGKEVQQNDQLKDGGYAALLNHLMNVDLTGYDVTDVPQTDALKKQKIHSLSQQEEWWFRKLQEGCMLDHHMGWQQVVPIHEMVGDFAEDVQRLNSSRRGSESSLGIHMNKMVPQLIAKLMTPEVVQRGYKTLHFHEDTIMKKRVRCYLMPTLATCRTHWVELYGDTDWDEADDFQDELTGDDVPF